MSAPLQYQGLGFFRQRVLLSLLSGKSFSLQHVRGSLTQTHANFLRLMHSLTTGTTIRIEKASGSGNADTLRFVPGTIAGAQYLTHDCTLDRGLSYWIEPILVLLLYAKKPSSLTLRGCTNTTTDVSIDVIRNGLCPLFSRFGFQTGGKVSGSSSPSCPTVEIVSRGLPPTGGGEVRIFVPILRRPLPAVVLTDPGLIRRVRGVAYSCGVSEHLCRRLVTSAKGVLLQYIPNVYLSTDHFGRSRTSPGYGVYLEAETTTECTLFAQISAAPREVPEDVGSFASRVLFDEIRLGGCVCRPVQWFVVLLMGLSVDSRASRVRFGKKVSAYCVEMLRHMRDFLGVVFHVEVAGRVRMGRRKVGGVVEDEEVEEEEEVDEEVEVEEKEEDDDAESIVCTCIGCGMQNLAWKSS